MPKASSLGSNDSNEKIYLNDRKISKNSRGKQSRTKVSKINTAQNSKMVSFRQLTLKMLNLTNMIHSAQMASLFYLRNQYSGSVSPGSPLKDQQDAEAEDIEAREPVVEKRQKLTASGKSNYKRRTQTCANSKSPSTLPQVQPNTNVN